MPDANNYSDFQIAAQERRQAWRLRYSLLRTALGYAAVFFSLYNAFFVEDRATGMTLAVFFGIVGMAILAGYTPRLLARVETAPYVPIAVAPSGAAKAHTLDAAYKSGNVQSPRLADLDRKLEILFIIRMLGLIGMLIIIVSWTLIDQKRAKAAHFERFGTYEGVSINVALDGTETVTIDPNANRLSVRTRYEQPPHTDPTPATEQAAPATTIEELDTAPPVNRTPIIPPNPPLPSYWPTITPGYSAKIYYRTPSGALELIEIRLQYPDGKLYAVGP
ncbi:hypothetical protein L0666_02075 [Octadecabacter sp. CECT 8868]|uniref:hypothetical protein n=1 Tax=Octadecabacter algicola TaxID=2909342 RepID=UPI001F471FDF|nr:hypothetical protein [Octadecabacter algicola]MCF2903761.1 hypothetical protein [Octadecabacter algicola]